MTAMTSFYMPDTDRDSTSHREIWFHNLTISLIIFDTHKREKPLSVRHFPQNSHPQQTYISFSHPYPSQHDELALNSESQPIILQSSQKEEK